jgi:hypothetical protein
MARNNIRSGRAIVPGRVLMASALAVVGLAAASSCDTATPTETVALPIGAYNNVGQIPGNGRPFNLEMSQEVTATNPPGDPDGAGIALLTINAGQRTVCWSLTAWNIALPATASHVHKAPPGVAGPVVIGLSPPDGNGASTGCATDVDRDLLVDILTSPEAYYVNVHTTEHPPGAIRSQMR